jgi:uroporphyrinogen-III synthase
VSSLAGRRVVVTRAEGQAAELVRELAARGAVAVALPVIAIADPPRWDEVDAALRRAAAGAYEWALFTSVNAVERVMRRAQATPHAFATVPVAAVGPATERALRAHGILPALVPPRHTGEELVSRLGKGRGRVLLPRVEGGPRALVDELAAAGWAVDEVTAYRNLPADPGPELEGVRAGCFDAVVLTSGSTARGFVDAVGPPERLGIAPGHAAERVIACIGPQTAAAAASAGLRVDVVAREHTAAGTVAALEAALEVAAGMRR